MAKRKNGHSPFQRLLFSLAIVSSSFLLNADCVRADDQLADALKAVQAVQLNGVGNVSAVKAMRILNKAPIDQIPAILTAMDGANVISQNWLRSAVVSVAGRGGDLPRKQIEDYFNDQSHSPMGRLVAFNLLTNGDDERAKTMIPFLIDDTSMPLRQKAIAALINDADALSETDRIAAIGLLGHALDKARDVRQITAISKRLNDCGIKIDLRSQLGFLSAWHLVGCFDNQEMAGFNVAFGPEEAIGMIDLNATYQDQDGNEARWKAVSTNHETGNVDLNDLIGKVKGATVYAYGTFKSTDDRSAEIRIGTANATKIWLNGELVMTNEIYHNSNAIDKFSATVNLRKGENQFLIKVCQNEQTEAWAQDWQFQIRICDESGKAIAPESAVEVSQ